MSIEALRVLAADAADALDSAPDINDWPGVVNDLLAELCELAVAAGIDAKRVADELEPQRTDVGLKCVSFVATTPPEVRGIGTETAAELAAWAAFPGAGYLYGSYCRIRCIEGAAWPLHAFMDGTLSASAYLDTPSLGPHAVVQTLVLEEFIFDDDATPIDELEVGDWGLVAAGAGEQQWLILSDEYREQAILAAPHLATAERPLPIFWCDWMDEIGLTYLGGSARQALRTLLRRGIKAMVCSVADLIGLSRSELRNVVTDS